MKPRPILLASTLLIASVGYAQAQEIRAITGATLIDGVGRAPIINAVIVIEGARITQAGAADKTKIPAGAQVIDARGKFVIPGLADMHNHLGDGYFLPGQGGGPPNFRQNLAQLLGWGFTTIHCPARTDQVRLSKIHFQRVINETFTGFEFDLVF
jgi:cytosine/adenosine deaminase-related metal-dependent hydrolase